LAFIADIRTKKEDYRAGPASEVLTEEALTALYGVPLKRISLEHEGRLIETLTPILPMTADIPVSTRE